MKTPKRKETLEEIRARWRKEDKRDNERLAFNETTADAQMQADIFFDYQKGEVY